MNRTLCNCSVRCITITSSLRRRENDKDFLWHGKRLSMSSCTGRTFTMISSMLELWDRQCGPAMLEFVWASSRKNESVKGYGSLIHIYIGILGGVMSDRDRLVCLSRKP